MRNVFLLARTDLRMLIRTRSLIALLAAYPLLVALVVGSILLNQGPPKIAFVNEDLTGKSVEIGKHKFSIDEYVNRAEKEGVDIVRLDRKEANRALASGQVAGVLVIPAGTVARMQTQLSATPIEFYVGDGAIGSVVAQRMRGVIYQVNLRISAALIDTNRRYLQILVDGGDVTVSGKTYDLHGLSPASKDLKQLREQLEQDPGAATSDELDNLDSVIDFAKDAGTAIGLADKALDATAAPIRLKVTKPTGTSPLFTAQALSFALATLISFVCVVLTGSLLAGERDDAVLARMLGRIISPLQAVTAKIIVGSLLGTMLSTGLFIAFALLEPQAWGRLPILMVAAAISSAACGAIGALIAVITRTANIATLVGILLVLPLIPLMLVNVGGVAGWVVSVLPLEPSRVMFNTLLFDHNPWKEAALKATQLLALTLLVGAVATRYLRRLI